MTFSLSPLASRNPRARGGVFALAMLVAGCSSEDRAAPMRLDRPPLGSPFAEQRAPDDSRSYSALSRQVEIVTDEFGVPHIFAENRKDLFFANGYVHARDRLFLMDALRLLGQGRISEYVGAMGMSYDPVLRATFMTADGEQVADAVVAVMPANIRELLQAYADGVNAYLAELRAGQHELPPDYSLPLFAGVSASDIADWQPRDTVAVSRMADLNNSDGAGDVDIAMGERIQALSPDLLPYLARIQPSDPTVILPEWLSQPQSADVSGSMSGYPDQQRRFQGLDFAKLRRMSAPLPDSNRQLAGSNNWVIAGEHTANGYPIVANDPHLAFIQPARFYNVQLDTRLYGHEPASDSSAMGVNTPGIPAILLGHNEFVAWGATNVGWDLTDVYIETLDATGDAVLFEGRSVPIRRFSQTFKLGPHPDSSSETRVVEYVPHHGPLSRVGDQAFSIKWAGRFVDSDSTAMVDLLTCRNIDDWMRALESVEVLALSWNGADTEGNTGYYPHARIPLRKSVTGECVPNAPVSGTGACEWIGFVPTSQIPQVKNRARGYLVTANNDVVGTLQDNDPTNDPQYLVAERDIGFRAGRITRVIEQAIASEHKITLDDTQALQADNTDLEAGRLRPFLLAAARALPNRVSEYALGAALTRLENWRLTTPSGVSTEYRTDGGPSASEIEESIASSIYYAWASRFRHEVLDDEFGALTPGYGERPKTVLFLLEHPDPTGEKLFDNINTAGVETKDELMLQALSEALEFLASPAAFGTTDMSAWRWGQLHQVELSDLLGSQLGVPLISSGPYPRGGGMFTVDLAPGGGPTSFIYKHGPQMRFVAEVRPDGIVSRNALPGGQSDDPDSSHYEDLLKKWLRNESFPYYFRVEDVAAHIERYELLHP